VKTFKIGEYLAKLQARAWLSHVLCAVANTLLKDEESTQDSHVLVCYFVKYSLILNFFHSHTNNPFGHHPIGASTSIIPQFLH